MFGAKLPALIDRYRYTVVAADAQHLVGNYLCGASGSMPRSIFAIRSWCLRISTTIVITPPTRIAVIGMRCGPNPEIDPRAVDQGLLEASRAAVLALRPVLIIPGHGPAFSPHELDQ